MACPIDEGETAELVAVGQKGFHDKPQGGQAHAAGHQQHVPASGLLHRPAATVGAAHARGPRPAPAFRSHE